MAIEIVAALQVEEIDGKLLVDSRLIAERLGIQHKNLFATIKKYSDDFKEFGHLAFETETVVNSAGASNASFFALLSEPQATYLMTLSKNTDQVRRCKLDLVTAFEKAKSIIKTVIPAQNEQLEILKLQNENLRIKSSLISLHGTELALLLMGQGDRLVENKTVVTEIVEPATGKTTEILTADQLKRAVKQRTGQNVKSLKWFADRLRSIGRDDLLVPVTRSHTDQYPIPDRLDEALDLVYGSNRQRLIGE